MSWGWRGARRQARKSCHKKVIKGGAEWVHRTDGLDGKEGAV